MIKHTILVYRSGYALQATCDMCPWMSPLQYSPNWAVEEWVWLCDRADAAAKRHTKYSYLHRALRR